MKFSGFQKVSLIDYPERIASVLFTPGCNLRCPFCHNWRIVVDPKPPFLQEATVLEILEKRKKYVDTVVVTGGEPTMHKELPKLLAKLKERGFTVKLDTNGFYPEVLEECLTHVDYVALDVKTSPQEYSKLGASDTREFMRSAELLKTGKVNYEFRTTVVPGIVRLDNVDAIGALIKGTETYALQQFVPDNALDAQFRNLKPYSPEILVKFAEAFKPHAEKVILRV
jgi:pyruvate formate lyase activating enzyme